MEQVAIDLNLLENHVNYDLLLWRIYHNCFTDLDI